MKSRPLVSIITITFNLIKNNRESLFRNCVESVHGQTYGGIEHIIVDGASNDGTLDLIKEYADKGWISYVSEPDAGIYDAFNKGVKLAKGKYVAFLNSDDNYHDKEGVERSVEVLEDSGADFSYAPAVIKFEDGTLFSDHPQCNPKISNVFFTMPFCHQTMFTKREVILKEDMFDASYKSAADYDFVVKLCLKGCKSVFLKRAFVTYQFAGVSSTAQENSLNETADIWRRRYGTLYPINSEIVEAMRKNIYTGNYHDGIPRGLAKKFREFEPYFNYEEYSRNFKSKKDRGAIRRLINYFK
jgi:glycosyltransferase involved in cell wall biosynthesis